MHGNAYRGLVYFLSRMVPKTKWNAVTLPETQAIFDHDFYLHFIDLIVFTQIYAKFETAWHANSVIEQSQENV